MNLTKEQLGQILTFVKQKGFNYIDVQMEILDHVASSVEDKMSNNPELKFADAVNETHKSFGVHGFSSIEEGIKKVLNRKYKRVFFSNLLSFFKLKYLPIKISAFFFLYKIQYFVRQSELMLPLFMIAMVALIVILIVQFFKSGSVRNYLAYRSSAAYLAILGPFLSFGNILNNKIQTTYFDINLNFLITSIMVGIFYMYVVSSIKTARLGIAESKSLMEKYKLINFK